MFLLTFWVNYKLDPLEFGMNGFYILKFQNFDFTSNVFGVFRFYIMTFQILDFTPIF